MLPTLQRFGYMLEKVLDKQKTADEIRMILVPYRRDLKYRPWQRNIRRMMCRGIPNGK